jgi:hypothetical protein
MMPGRSMERLSSNDLSRPKDYFLKIAPARLKEKPPKSLAHDVIDAGAYGLVAGRLENLRLRCVRNEGFLRGPESRAHQHAIGAEHQRRRQPAAIGDAARGQHQNVRRARAARASTTAGKPAEAIRRATPGQDQAADAGVLPCSSAVVVRCDI